MDKIYQERANGRWEYWTYSEGQRHYIPAELAARWLAKGTAELVEVR
jgi:hypothetical protein